MACEGAWGASEATGRFAMVVFATPMGENLYQNLCRTNFLGSSNLPRRALSFLVSCRASNLENWISSDLRQLGISSRPFVLISRERSVPAAGGTDFSWRFLWLTGTAKVFLSNILLLLCTQIQVCLGNHPPSSQVEMGTTYWAEYYCIV